MKWEVLAAPTALIVVTNSLVRWIYEWLSYTNTLGAVDRANRQTWIAWAAGTKGRWSGCICQGEALCWGRGASFRSRFPGSWLGRGVWPSRRCRWGCGCGWRPWGTMWRRTGRVDVPRRRRRRAGLWPRCSAAAWSTWPRSRRGKRSGTAVIFRTSWRGWRRSFPARFAPIGSSLRRVLCPAFGWRWTRMCRLLRPSDRCRCLGQAEDWQHVELVRNFLWNILY